MKISKNNSLKIIVFTLLSIFFTTSVIAQSNNAKNNFWEHVRFGGGLGLSTGNNIFSATVAPSAIYDFDSQFSLGVGLNYTYFSRKNIAKSTILGGSIIGLFNPIQEIQLSGEFEQNHVSRNFDNPAIVDDEYWVSSFFIGAGYRTNNITIGVRYDVLYDEDKSIYANAWAPFVRVYF
ncbi:alpha-ketoglutarate decarboxylase [Lacinutrix venerupis]|uniref:Alpha-ketoglutarate decarboxylase n=1 Tax=Lacinutrix venerupis TaxID=1486034 RepID=A0AAC9PV74_9FLAO|nr:alpha-ketoglutarate decarboxylase [Lacinutrix venerupis]APX99241.1 alpha-ketoglutarate decarboxylase [Lacinutrix venerupis]